MTTCDITILQTKRKIFLSAVLCCLAHCFYNVQSTEVTVVTTVIDDSIGLAIELPVLECHARHSGYSKVIWYKDFVILKNGSSDMSSHFLSLISLQYSHTEEFDYPLKLQGYYWCVTDRTELSNAFKYLFQIQEIHTFVGRFIATADSFEDDETDEDDKDWEINLKKKLYEEEMESILFGFSQDISVYVTDIKELAEGLDVRFFIYVRPVINPRKPVDEKLILDQDYLEYILEYINNESSVIEPGLYITFLDWTDSLGIDIQQISLRSTLGCYEASSSTSSDAYEVVWPSARIGEVVIPVSACSSKNDVAVTRLCTGSFYTGAKWGNPSGKCEKPAEGITLDLKNIYDNYGYIKREQTIDKLVAVTEQTRNLRIADLHIALNILNELSSISRLSFLEISDILSVIDNIIDANKTELNAAKDSIQLTSRILQIFDKLLKQIEREQKEIQITKHHLMLDTKYTKTEDERNPILGLAVIAQNLSESLDNVSIEVITSKTMLPLNESLAYFTLPRELVLQRETDMEDSFLSCQVNVVFFKDWNLFQNPKGMLVDTNYEVLPSPVMYVSLSGGPAWNLTDPVHLYFKDTSDSEVEFPVCVYYDSRLENGSGSWSSEGCEYKGYENGYYHCQCHHLSIFGVILMII